MKREAAKADMLSCIRGWPRREGKKDLYSVARQTDGAGNNVQQVRVIQVRDGNILACEESELRRRKESFEGLMDEENDRERRMEEVSEGLVEMKFNEEWKGPDDIAIEEWKCLGKRPVEFLMKQVNMI